MRDEMANLAWAIERTVESPIEQPAQRYEAPDAVPRRREPIVSPHCRAICCRRRCRRTGFRCCRCRFRTRCVRPRAGQILSRLKRGAVLQPDGTKKVHTRDGRGPAVARQPLLYDEEVPREGARITRQRRLARWTDGSTWLWTSFRIRSDRAKASSQLKFDQVIEPGETR